MSLVVITASGAVWTSHDEIGFIGNGPAGPPGDQDESGDAPCS